MWVRNSFIKGLNVDTSKEKRSPDSLLDANNIRISNDEALGFGVIENVKGTKLSFKIPDTKAVIKLEYDFTVAGTYFLDFLNTDTSTLVTVTVTVNESTTIKDIYDIIVAQLTFNAVEIKIWYNNNHIIISPYSNFVITSSSSTFVLSTLVSAQTNLFITGWSKVRDYIVIFTTSKTNTGTLTNPNPGPGQIWLIKYDEVKEQIIDNESLNTLLANGDFLNPTNHLIYNNNLDFTRAYPIINEIVTRYENSSTIRVVWTDFYNKLRSINVKDEQVFAIPVGTLSINSEVLLSQPTLKKTLAGGQLPNGRVSYFYSLKDNSGNISAYSPVSNLITTNPGTDGDFPNYQDFQGGNFGGNSGKAINFIINDIDTNFTIIELYYILYEQNNIPKIYKFKEDYITGSSMEFIHNGDPTNDINITYEEFLKLRKLFDTCKTIETKNNRLFASNTKLIKKDLSDDFDARTYRFQNTTNQLHLWKKTTNTPDLFIINTYNDYLNINTNHDAVNAYNDETGTVYNLFPAGTPNDWDTNTAARYHHKYQYNSAVVGGSGANISYKFTTKEFIGDNHLPAGATTPVTAPFLSSDIYNAGNENLGIVNQDYNRNSTYDNLKSPYATYLYTGYASGEVYRFGIVFYDTEGYPYLPLWIGDIKFPLRSDSGFALTNYSNDKQRLLSLGVEFTIDTTTTQFQNIKDKISGWKIVRLERTEIDKTKLGMGAVFDVFNDSGAGADVLLADGTLRTSCEKIANTPTAVQPMAGYNSGTNNIIKSPLAGFDKYRFKDGDYLKTVHSYLTEVNQYYAVAPSEAYWGKFTSISASPTTSHRRGIDKITTVGNVSALSNSFDSSMQADGFFNVTAVEGGGTAGEVNGLGSILHYAVCDTAIELLGGNYRVSSYERYNQTQYKGPFLTDRYDNKYISTGHFQKWNFNDLTDPINTISPTDVFGGDTYVVYYADLVYSFGSDAPSTESYGFTNNGAIGREYAIVYPVEIPFNVELRQGRTWAKDRDNTNMLAWLFEDFTYNNVYHQESNTEQFFSKPFNFKTEDEQPYTIYASEIKLDGETTDSWKKFAANTSLSVEGQFGQINKIIAYNNKLYYLQDSAFGLFYTEDRTTTNDGTVEETQIGFTNVLSAYNYLSTDAGTIHQYSVISALNGLYFVDALNKKAFRFNPSNGLETLSVSKNMNSFFRQTLDNSIRKGDNLLIDSRYGIHGAYDPEFNTIYWTFVNIKDDESRDEDSVTIAFNELLDYFESKHDFKPSLYLNTGRRLLSCKYDENTGVNNKVYIHNRDNYGYIYEQYVDAYFKILINDKSKYIKRLDSLSLQTEVTINGVDTASGVSPVQESLNELKITNDYQDTGLIALDPTNFDRRTRRWYFNNLKDVNSPSYVSSNLKPRLKDFYFNFEGWFTNNNNKRIIVTDILSNLVIYTN